MGEVTRYSNRENAWNKSEKRRQTELQLAQGFRVADIYLNRTYLDGFSAAPIVPASRNVLDVSSIRLIEISKLVLDSSEKFIDKLMSVYSSLYSIQSSVATIVHSDGNSVRFFIGIRAERNGAIAGDILESTLKGNFPGIVFDSKNASSVERIISDIRKTDIKSLSTVSIVPSTREEMHDTESFVQGIEKFIDTMSGKAYTMVCLAKATQIFNDEHTQNQLQNAQYFGQKEWNDWNMPAIKSLAIYGSIFAGLGLFSSSGAFLGLGLVFYAIMGLLIYFSFRPYWQINKTYVTGQMGQMEQVVNQLGDYSAKAAVFMLRALIKIVGLILRFVFGLASGRWF